MFRRMPLAKKSNNTGDNQARRVTRHNSRPNPAEGESRQDFAGPRGAKTERCGPAIQGNLGGQGTFTGESRDFRDWHAACENGR